MKQFYPHLSSFLAITFLVACGGSQKTTTNVEYSDCFAIDGSVIFETWMEEFEHSQERFANDYPEEEFAPLELYNSGIVHEELREYQLAIHQFEQLIQEYPESHFVDDALGRIAVNSKKVFDLERSIATFITLYEREYSCEQVQCPLLDAAQLLQYEQQYEASADTFMVFVEEHPNTLLTPAVFYLAARLYGQAGNHELMFELYSDFRDEYENDYSELFDIDAAVIISLQTEALYRAERDEIRVTEQLNERILEEYNQRQTENPAVVAAIVYQQAMNLFNEWDSITFDESISSQQDTFNERLDGIEEVMNAFSEVVDYGVADWSVCAGYQVGNVYKAMAETIMSLPMPDFHGDVSAEDDYILMLEDLATQYEQVAVQRWEDFAYPFILQFRVRNECAINTMQELNRFLGIDYPVFMESHR